MGTIVHIVLVQVINSLIVTTYIPDRKSRISLV